MFLAQGTVHTEALVWVGLMCLRNRTEFGVTLMKEAEGNEFEVSVKMQDPKHVRSLDS